MFAQFIFDTILKTPVEQKFKIKLLKFIRQIILKYADSEVNYVFNNFNLAIYFSHDFPFNLKEIPQYSQNLGKIAQIMHQKYSDLSMIDIGANIGDSVAIVKTNCPIPILCVEGNPRFLGLLKKNLKQFRNVSIEKSFVGEFEDTVNAVNNIGTAFLQKSEKGIPVLPFGKIIEKNPDFSGSKLLKIDTDGFDNMIIRGAKTFLQGSKAAIFFEYDPYFLSKQNEKGIDIYDFLVSLNYKKFIIFDNLGDQLITLHHEQKNEFIALHNYFNKGGSKYMDIWVLHEEDSDLQY